ncbi:uncharacterized protein LOC131246845 [Magnolia sinica]|uniref:uncharacterized protein LOC131246845 n=1 Tax=Magnolia sinica TaxID=86752 RepID=UPI00265B627A|nr:uncharacterized protein LOC131246845 [Magnolia sinica]
MNTNKVPMLCRFGGNFIWESDKVYYKGGTNHIVYVDRAINYHNLLSKVCGICKLTDISNIKYKYPGLDLDSLVSIENDDDVTNMMEAFPQSSKPIQLFLSGDQNLSIPIAVPSFLMQNADNGNDQASLQDLHESNGTLAPSSHNTNTSDNDVRSAPNDSCEMNRLLMDNRELPCGMVATSVNEMPKMISVLKEGQEYVDANVLQEGQEFVDANAFHKSLREYAIRSHFEYRRTRSGGGHYQAKCINGDCSWRIHVCKLPDNHTFKIKSLKGNHTCNVMNNSTMSNTTTHRQANRKWIAALVKDRFQNNLRCKPKDIVDQISQEYRVKVSYDKAWRGIELALKERHLEQSVSALRTLCEEIQTTNPGSTANLSRSSDNSLRLFVAYEAAIRGFKQACRPVVMLGFRKMEGKCRGVWLYAMAIDAEEYWFPVSCAFVESKNVSSWKWFCDELAQVLGFIPKLTFISNRQEGILEVVSGIFPHACHRYYQKELVEEIQQKFRHWDLVRLFENAVDTGVCYEFDASMREIHDKYKEAGIFVKDINPKHWATSHFEEKLYVAEDVYLEFIGKWRDKLEEWRDLPITSVLENLHLYMIEIFDERFKKSSDWETILVPRVEALISILEMPKGNYSVSYGAADFEVLDKDDADANSLKVDLERQTCSCRLWQMKGYPCPHAIAAIRYNRRNVYDYVDVHYTVAKYRHTYSEHIDPLHLPNTSLSLSKKRKQVELNEVSLTDQLQ